MQFAWWRYNAAARKLTLTVHVQPNASSSGVAGIHGDALKIRIAAPAVDDKANAALIAFVSEILGISPRAVVLIKGARGRRKILEIREAAADLISRLEVPRTGS